jgi:ubiquinone biosynthesis protein Coq4
MRINYQNLAEQPQHLDQLLQLAQLAESCDTTVEDTFHLANSLRDSPQMQRCVARLMQDPSSCELIRSRQLHIRRPPEELARFEPGTLGQIYYEVIKHEGLSYTYGPDPDYFNNLETDADYVNYRVFCTHDFYHIVSGFALDVFGEIGARSLLVAQCGYPPMALTDVVNLLTSWLANDICPGDDKDLDGDLSEVYLLDVMAMGIRMAKASLPLFGTDWDGLLHLPLEQVRQRLQITPVTEGRYSWHSQGRLAHLTTGLLNRQRIA